ncbi:RNA-binding cell elongation regulator Jag/EloR [Cohnella sp. AR92]|uniref:RNA-binding cell elongation regulator Jag/EloR n=1 Tax=Cohnella sp. AR92 TaxID=648716 RepID=UPI000F8CA354|nr:RNA-binding cell elongation regulator Jag/EloR [Cohnella sp. AR92]RUS48784.1 protein jag [Cohnella sp. AR92]
MKKLVAIGKTVEAAVKNGLSQLGVEEDRVQVSILEHPSRGLFGLFGSKDAKVELEVKPDGIEEAISFLQEVTGAMDLQVKVERNEGSDHTTINLTGNDLGILIGRRGQTLDSLQYLANIVANRHSDKHLRIVLDAEKFRERRKQTLEALSDRMANRVIRSRREVVLEPMSSQERKIIHSWLQSNPHVKTYSQGDEPNRSIVIAPK